MHYKDGTPVQLNDLCIKECGGEYQPIVGYVRQLYPSATSCNMLLAALTMTNQSAGTDKDRLPEFPAIQLYTVTSSEFSLLHRRPSKSDHEMIVIRDKAVIVSKKDGRITGQQG